MYQRIEKIILITAAPSAVWDSLTNPDLIKQWMGEPELGIEVITSWEPGSPLVIKGYHHVHFQNVGTVLQFEPYTVIEYNYLSSLSGVPDKPENYSTIKFTLSGKENETLLTLAISNFPTTVIFKHVNFYWTGTLVILKKFIENRQRNGSSITIQP